MDASAKLFVAVDVLVEGAPALVGDGFDPQPARVVASTIVTIQQATGRCIGSAITPRDILALGSCCRARRLRLRPRWSAGFLLEQDA